MPGVISNLTFPVSGTTAGNSSKSIMTGNDAMKNEFTALLKKDGDWFIGYCAEIPNANGQGKTKDECLKNLSYAIELILEDKREDSLRSIHDYVTSEMVTVG